MKMTRKQKQDLGCGCLVWIAILVAVVLFVRWLL